jgi:branched-chain amino acid transport system permease protein
MAIDLPSIFFSGVFLSIFAIGISLNFRIAKFLNLAYGSIFTLGAYITFFAFKAGLSFGLSLVISAIVAFLVGSFQFLIIRRMGREMLEATIISLGIGIAIEEIIRISQKTGYYLVLDISEPVFSGVGLWDLIELLILVSMISALLMIYSSRYGIKLKFIEDDVFLAVVYGVNVERFSFICVSISSAFIAILGGLTSTQQALFPAIGWTPLISGILIAAIAAQFKGIGIVHHIRIITISMGYAMGYALLAGYFALWS